MSGEQSSVFEFEDVSLEELESKARSALKNRRVSAYADIDQRLDDALARATEIEGREFKTRDVRSTIDEVMTDFQQEERDLTDVVSMLYEFSEAQGAQLTQLGSMMHPEGQGIIDDAKADVETAQEGVNKAKVAVGLAESGVTTANALSGTKTWFGKKQKAVDAATKVLTAAQARLTEAEMDLANARTALEQAPAKAAAKHREMLQNATMEESNQRIQLMHETANNIVRENMESAGKALERRLMVIDKTRQRLEKVTTEVERATTEMSELEPQYEQARQRLESGELERNTEEYRSLENQVSELATRLGQLKGAKDAATGEAEELEEKLIVLEGQRDALITLRANYERSLRIGVASAKANAEVASARLEIIKGMSDLQVQERLNSVSRDNTLAAHQNAGDAINAVERSRIQYRKDHPKLMDALDTVNQFLAEAREAIAEEDRALDEEMSNRSKGKKAEGALPSGKPAATGEAFSF